MAMASSPAACKASELVAKGRDSAAVLQALLSQQQPDGFGDLAEQILRCCDRALAALRSGAEGYHACGTRKRTPSPESYLAALPFSTSSKRMRVSGGEKGRRVEKHRTMDDGFIWRKYGQKEICGSKYPRLYFRCTYKDDRGCMAKRQVQQSCADPSVAYLVTYFGEHTCCRHDDEPAPPFVINFGSSTCGGDGQPNVSPVRPSCEDDYGLAVSESEASDLCNSPENELLAELIEQSMPVPEQVDMSTPGWNLLDGCLDWEFPDDESSFDIGQFINFDYFCLLQ